MVNRHWNICPYFREASLITSFMLCALSVGTLTAISADRLLALLLGLRYSQVLTLKRTYLIVFTLWVLPALFLAMLFRYPLISVWYGIIYITVCLTIPVFSYTRIFFILRHHKKQLEVQDHAQQPNQTNQLNIARYKKAVFSAIWLQLTMIACYLPSGIYLVIALHAKGEPSASLYLAWIYTTTLVYLNPSLNPIIYCWKLDEVRQAVKNTIRQVLFFCFSI